MFGDVLPMKYIHESASIPICVFKGQVFIAVYAESFQKQQQRRLPSDVVFIIPPYLW